MKNAIKITTVVAIGVAAGLGALNYANISSAKVSSSTQVLHTIVDRVQSFQNIGELIDSSNLVVTGTVVKEEIVTDAVKDAPVLESTFEIKTVLAGAVPGGKSTVVVRMYTSTSNQDKSNVLKVGSDYMLFLTDSGLKGDLASQYYVTGYEAGAYVADSTTDGVTTYKRLIKTEGDVLPATLTEADVAKN